MRRLSLISACLLLLAAPVAAQQVPDPAADATMAHPRFPAGTGPRVAIDSGHHEINTLEGRYALFGRMAANDGYRVADFQGALTVQGLSGVDVLVISNPTPNDAGHAAFSRAEAESLRAWVEAGGALLLIVDHTPMTVGVGPVAEVFGLTFLDGYVVHGGTPEIFARADGTLGDHPITRGEGGGEPIARVRAFTGSAFTPPSQATVLMRLDDRWRLVRPSETVKSVLDLTPGVPSEAVTGYTQGAAWTLGKGRVVVLGEAAMFNAQLIGPSQKKAGINAEGAEQNKAFLSNILRWLTPTA